jgi:hypothetical protein
VSLVYGELRWERLIVECAVLIVQSNMNEGGGDGLIERFGDLSLPSVMYLTFLISSHPLDFTPSRETSREAQISIVLP